ncbi:hypothetical protein M153_60020001263, partial [Pseudoloma neurophilia]
KDDDQKNKLPDKKQIVIGARSTSNSRTTSPLFKECKILSTNINLKIYDDFQAIASEDFLVFINNGLLNIVELEKMTILKIEIFSLLKDKPLQNIKLYVLENNYLVIRTMPDQDSNYNLNDNEKDPRYKFLKKLFNSSHNSYVPYDFIFFILNKHQNKILIRESFILENARQVLLFSDHYIYVRDRVFKRKYRKLKETVILEDTVDQIFVIDDLVYFRIGRAIYSTISPVSLTGLELSNISEKYMLLTDEKKYQIIDKSERIPVSTHTYNQNSKMFGNFLALFEQTTVNLIDLSSGFFKPRGALKVVKYQDMVTYLTCDGQNGLIFFVDDENSPRSVFLEQQQEVPEEPKSLNRKLPGNFKHEQVIDEKVVKCGQRGVKKLESKNEINSSVTQVVESSTDGVKDSPVKESPKEVKNTIQEKE